MAQRPEPRSRAGAIFDAVSIGLFLAASLGLWLALLASAGPLQVAIAVALLALPALMAAELAAGLFHWVADTFFTPEAPWIGPTLIKSFRDHHTAPGEMAALPGCWVATALLLFTLGIALTNLFHQWAHAERVPAVVARLQRGGWILSPAHHALHHCGAHDRAYCVTTGWLNPTLDAIGFFPALERAVRRLAPAGRRPLAKGSRAH